MCPGRNKALIQCSNPSCQGFNDTAQDICGTCDVPLIHRHLWIAGDVELAPGTVLAERYQVLSESIALDLTPALLPLPLPVLPEGVMPYLRLSHLSGQVPLLFTALTPSQLAGAATEPLLLLEQAPIARTAEGARLMPTLRDVWGQSTPLRQLNWLRQIAQLWQPLQAEGVAQTLLTAELLRVEGSWLRLLALAAPQPSQPSLADLGALWQRLGEAAHPAAAAYLRFLATQMQQGDIEIAAVIGQLEGAIATLAAAQPVQVAIAAQTDRGSSRPHNEDACYPDSGHTLGGVLPAKPPATPMMLVVCDGIGGHEGGEVASELAIATLRQQLQSLQQPGLPVESVKSHLRQAIVAANEAIYQRNNSEQRQARGRMGTTLVVALTYPPFLFIAHVGDSRAYRITAFSCSQITLDDDVASREARLGHALHRDALHLPGAGSLVQALGIETDEYLYPTIQCHLLDDSCLYLVCSDGLSDYDRVDALWWTELRPGSTPPVGPVSQRLIQLANRYNGHDNITVGLMSLNPLRAETFAPLPPSPLSLPSPVPPVPPPRTTARPQAVVPTSSRRPWLPLLAGLAVLAGAGLGWLLWRPAPPAALRSLSLNLPAVDFSRSRPQPTAAIVVGSYWQINAATAGVGLVLGESPEVLNGLAIPTGSILRVTTRQATPTQTDWVRLQVCSIPGGTSLADVPSESDVPPPPASPLPRLAEPGSEGWMPETQLAASAQALANLPPPQRGQCP